MFIVTLARFYPSMQYLTSSKLSIAVMGNLGFAMALCLYRVLTKVSSTQAFASTACPQSRYV
jgi:hypothetical protein